MDISDARGPVHLLSGEYSDRGLTRDNALGALEKIGSPAIPVMIAALAIPGTVSSPKLDQGISPFTPAPAPRDEDVAPILAPVRTRIGQRLARHRLEPQDDAVPAGPLASRRTRAPARGPSATRPRMEALTRRARRGDA